MVPKLIELGVDSFKIEGRMKSLHYIATVVSTYRKLIDTYCADPDHFNKEGYRKEIEKAANRALCTGFFKDFPDSQYQLYNQEMNINTRFPVRAFFIMMLQNKKR